jgi:hypothetical protein
MSDKAPGLVSPWLLARIALAWPIALGSPIALGFAAAGCDDDKATIDANAADAGDAGDEGPVLGGKIGEAVAAAESLTDAGAKAAAQEAPPEAGIFAPGVADEKHKAGAEPKVELIDDGSEPRFVLERPRLDSAESMVLVLQIRTGQPGFPPLKLGLRVAPPEAPTGDAPPAGGQRKATVELRSVEVAGAESMALPKQVVDALDSLKGSAIHFTLGPTGPVDTRFELAEKGEAGLANVLRATMDVISLVWVPTPDKPVGVGAYWMATDRLPSFGIDAVRYRVFKVQSISRDKVELTTDLRQYAASGEVDLPETRNVTLAQYDQTGNAKLTLQSGHAMPETAEVTVRTQALLAPPGAKNAGAQMQVQPMQIEVQAQLVSTPAGVDEGGAAKPKPEAPKAGGGSAPPAPPPAAPPPAAPPPAP